MKVPRCVSTGCSRRAAPSHYWSDGLWYVGQRCSACARPFAEARHRKCRLEIALLRRYAADRDCPEAESYADLLADELDLQRAHPPSRWDAVGLFAPSSAEQAFTASHGAAFRRWATDPPEVSVGPLEALRRRIRRPRLARTQEAPT